MSPIWNITGNHAVNLYRDLTFRGIDAHSLKARLRRIEEEFGSEIKKQIDNELELLYSGVKVERRTIMRGKNKGKMITTININEIKFAPNINEIAMLVSGVDAKTLEKLSYAFFSEENQSVIGVIFSDTEKGVDEKEFDYRRMWWKTAESIISILNKLDWLPDRHGESIDNDGLLRAQQWFDLRVINDRTISNKLAMTESQFNQKWYGRKHEKIKDTA